MAAAVRWLKDRSGVMAPSSHPFVYHQRFFSSAGALRQAVRAAPFVLQDHSGNAAQASAFLSGCLEAGREAAAAASSPSAAASPFGSSVETSHEVSGAVLLRREAKQSLDEDHLGHISTAFAAADAPSSGEEAIMDTPGLSSGLDSEAEDVYASWDHLLHEGGHGSSPTSAVAIVQVPHEFTRLKCTRALSVSYGCELSACKL